MNQTFIEKNKESEKYKELRKILRGFEYNPPTGFGKTLVEIDWKKDDIISVEVTTKNIPPKEDERG